MGHRIVNGGSECTQPAIITPEVKAAIQRMAVFAPLHNRVELQGIKFIEEKFGSIPQVAVFDTAFHSTLPDAAFVYPVLLNGSRKEFAALDSTESITNIARNARPNSSGKTFRLSS